MADKNYRKAIESFLGKKVFGEVMSPWSVSARKGVVTLWRYDARIAIFRGSILTICPESLNGEAIRAARGIVAKSWNALEDVPWLVYCYQEGFYLGWFLFPYPLILNVRRKKILSKPRLSAIFGQLIKARREGEFLNIKLTRAKEIMECFGLEGFTDIMLKEMIKKIVIEELYNIALYKSGEDLLGFWDILPEGKKKFLSGIYEVILRLLEQRYFACKLSSLKTLSKILKKLGAPEAPEDLLQSIDEKMVVLCMTQEVLKK